MSFLNAKSYLHGNNHVMNCTKVHMNKFYHWIEQRQDGKDSFLDVGSGPGNIFRDVVYPLLPRNFSRLVCSDISQSMVEMQKEVFKGYDHVSCEILNITAEITEELSQRLGTFDHVTSFFCLHYVKDQQKAMDNILKLLKPGGDCLLAIPADSPVLSAVLSVCETPRWKEYFIGWQDLYAYPYRNIGEAKEKGLKFMENAGFVDTKAELIEIPVEMSSDEQKENFIRAVPNKFSKEISPEEEEEILQERLQYLDQFYLGKYRDNTGKIYKPSTQLALYGKKLNNKM